MTEKEAIHFLECEKNDSDYYRRKFSNRKFYEEIKEKAYEIAFYAIHKQIPKKLTFTKRKYEGAYSCPNCNNFFDYAEKFNYCPNCGQRIDWSEEKEESKNG